MSGAGTCHCPALRHARHRLRRQVEPAQGDPLTACRLTPNCVTSGLYWRGGSPKLGPVLATQLIPCETVQRSTHPFIHPPGVPMKMSLKPSGHQPDTVQPDAVQGEGDYQSAKTYGRAVRSFVDSGQLATQPGKPRRPPRESRKTCWRQSASVCRTPRGRTRLPRCRQRANRAASATVTTSSGRSEKT